jgi:hypothetical protein
VTAIEEDELLAAASAGTTLSGARSGARGGAPGRARRSLDAVLLRRCCRELAGQVDPRGLRLAEMRVTGQLDLAGVAVPFPLRFDRCLFDAPVIAEGAELFELSLTGCELPGLLANGLRLRRDLDLSGSVITGSHQTTASIRRRSAVWLSESVIGGRLQCADTRIDGQGDRALQADRIRIGGTARFIHQFTALGEVRLIGARIDGALELTGAHITARGVSLDLEGAAIAGRLLIVEDPSGRKPVFRGLVDLGSASIAGGISARSVVIEPGEPGEPYTSYVKSFTTGRAIRARRLSVGGELAFESDCQITGGIDLFMSDLGSMWIGAGTTISAPGATALELANSQVRGPVMVARDTTVHGTVRLECAVVHGGLAMRGSLGEPENKSLVAGTGLTVDGDLWLGDLDARGGRLNLRAATIGSINATGARLDNPADYTLSLNQASVRGSVQLMDGFAATGRVVLTRCRIEGRLRLSGGSFNCPGTGETVDSGPAIEAISADVRGGMDLGWKFVSPSVDFTDASTTFLADDPRSWPRWFAISGFSYERFQAPQGSDHRPVWDARARCDWLNRQAVYDSGPYEQAARVFREHGYAGGADQILIAQRRQARLVSRTTANWPRRVLDRGYAAIGYGYRPWRVVWLIAALLALVTVTLAVPAGRATMRASNGNGDIFSTVGLVQTPSGPAGPRLAASQSCADGEVRCLSPFLYAVDTVIPLISLDQRSTWYPDPGVRYGELMLWWLDLSTILGWLLSSIFVLSLARLARSS